MTFGLSLLSYMISSRPVTSKSAIMIANNFSAREVKTVECWMKFRMYLIRVRQPSNSCSTAVRGPRQLIFKSDHMVFSCVGSPYLHESWAGNCI